MEEKPKISSGEQQIIALLQQGFSNVTISKKLGKSVNTVKYHLKKIFKKLHAKNRIEAINNFNKSLKNKQL